MPPIIQTPRGTIFYNKNGQKAQLTWNPQFTPKWRSKYHNAQFAHDKKVWEECEPFTPRKTGALILSGKLGSVFGSGQIRWIARYAARQYLMPRSIGPGLRGPYWFQRMKEIRGRAVIDETIKIFVRSG